MHDPYGSPFPGPQDPNLHEGCMRIDDMRTMAIAANELFLACQQAGFNENQAFELTKIFIHGGMS